MIDAHRKLLADRIRNQAYAEALKRVVRNGDTVVEIGSGTGFLCFLARRAGAGQVIGIEEHDVVKLAEGLARTNRLDNIEFRQGLSFEIDDLPDADVIVSETLGNHAFEEHLVENLVDARRYAKRDARFVPSVVRVFACPVTGTGPGKLLNDWDRIGFELDYRAAKRTAAQNLYVGSIAVGDLLAGATPQVIEEAVFTSDGPTPPSTVKGSASFNVHGEASVQGLAVWWEAELAPGVTLSTAPDAPATHWEQVYLPLQDPLRCAAGDTLDLAYDRDSRLEVGCRVRWKVDRISATGARSPGRWHDNLHGLGF